MTETTWPAEWLRGVLEVCVLHVIGRGPTYGYAIAQDLEDLGLGTVKGGTLYPLLTRCEQAGLVQVEWRPGDSGPGRKYYRLTPAGRAERDRRAAGWLEFSDRVRAAIVGEDAAEQDEETR